jgi:8-hydroxy-5-deazaflavin:NADPH oxidoreductase
MTMEKINKSKVAIIGPGNIGLTIAINLVRNNRPVILAGRDFTKAKNLSEKLGNLAQPMEPGAAIKEADIIIMAVWFDAIKELFYQYEGVLREKIIVDLSNPIAPDGKGGFVKKIGQSESAGQLHAEMLPKGAKLAKALGTLSATSLAGASNQKPEPAVLFYATDDTSINGEIEELIRDTGFEPLHIGGIDQSIRIEVFGDLHEFGTIGKIVTLVEAKEKAWQQYSLENK